MLYNSYKRLTNLFNFEYKTSFQMDHRLSNLYVLSVNLDPYKTSRGYPKLYDKSADIYKYDDKAGYNKLVFTTKDFNELKNWLKDHQFI